MIWSSAGDSNYNKTHVPAVHWGNQLHVLGHIAESCRRKVHYCAKQVTQVTMIAATRLLRLPKEECLEI